MTHFRINFKKFVGLSLWLMVMLSAPAVFAQPQLGQVDDEGFSSYIFSPRTVTVVLVLLLVAQLVYRNRTKRASPAMSLQYNAPMMPVDSPDPDQASKKRYDREELSKLLKASASKKNNGRSLEEAIRLSQAAQDDLLDTLDIRLDPNESVATVVDPELQDFESQEQFLEEDAPSVEVEPSALEAEPATVEAESATAEAESPSVEVDSVQEIETSK